jgi:hypothetical protein
MEAIINFSRPGKGTTRYIEELVHDDSIRVKTINNLSPEFSRKWCEEVWWKNGTIQKGILVGSDVKTLFYKEWFSVMDLPGIGDETLGYYVDIDTALFTVVIEFIG